jgi:RNA polymerase sigma-70 factor (ECF subfamily)
MTTGEPLLPARSLGDPRATDALLEQHLPALLAYVRLHCPDVVRDHESCGDVVQSVCREVLAGAEGFEFRGLPEFRKWLFAKVESKLVDKQRYWLAECRHPGREVTFSSGRSRLESLYASLCSPSRAAAARESLARFEAAFAELSEDDRRVITLVRLHGMSSREAAADLGKAEGAVRVMLHRALARLGMRMHEAAGS